ncbi:hypothetical protein G7K_2167-t1 [Saitoella complicata NRRL Y-17804]|uniref:Uncharacterized protein n=1 Tax=Saitoella complicata (strain BCRC 22490 / CBS 7301 / JCM 7358 / NBRC 10748 / NRRL Y-17804) TaxID=698492 RepID=A0A0E9NEZ9_SAICN|nr:hypothetical protein G7K_2167-t1 [Saitoella complicata NRRL Y-17804]
MSRFSQLPMARSSLQISGLLLRCREALLFSPIGRTAKCGRPPRAQTPCTESAPPKGNLNKTCDTPHHTPYQPVAVSEKRDYRPLRPAFVRREEDRLYGLRHQTTHNTPFNAFNASRFRGFFAVYSSVEHYLALASRPLRFYTFLYNDVCDIVITQVGVFVVHPLSYQPEHSLIVRL